MRNCALLYPFLNRRFTKNGHVKIVNFGSPYVGDRSFADAFRFQEKKFKLQFARFQNKGDICKLVRRVSFLCVSANIVIILFQYAVPHIPFNFLPEKVR